jgi:hypothetical protein
VGVSIAKAMVCSVCGVGGRARAPTQDPLEVAEGRERASMRMCAERRTSPEDAGR